MIEIPILLVLIVLSAFFSGLEIALFSLSESRLRSLADSESKTVAKQANRILQLKSKPEKLLVTILIGNNLVNIGSASIATAAAIKLFGSNGVGIATGVMTLLILIFGEILPKSIAQKHSDFVARTSSWPTAMLVYGLTPFSYLLEQLAHIVNKLTGASSHGEGVSEEEVKAMVYMGSESGNVAAEEREMIENIFTLNDVVAEDIMTQATDMVSIDVKLNIEDAARIIVETGFSRFPVYSKNIDNIEGVLYTKDFMTALVDSSGDLSTVVIRDLVKPAMFIPEQKPLDDLLRSFQHEKKHIAVVVNEFGETRGIVTLEDILEEIVGEINDEQDEQDESIIRINDRTILADADVDVGDIEDLLLVTLDEEKHKNIAWLILNVLGELPQKGDEISLGINGSSVKAIIEEAEETKIKRVKLIKIR